MSDNWECMVSEKVISLTVVYFFTIFFTIFTLSGGGGKSHKVSPLDQVWDEGKDSFPHKVGLLVFQTDLGKNRLITSFQPVK